MQNLVSDLKKALAPDPSLFEGDDLLRNAVIERALRMDPELISMLIASDRLKATFFTEAGGALVFDKVAFQRFVSNKAFLPDSYTAFKNRIGLMHGDDYLKQRQDVVLAWPYKDCVLEGGMTREDRGRDEIFWNEILAPDDISRLFEPKVMTNFQKWDNEAVAAGEPKPVHEIGMEDNLLIKGNNLLALHTLKARYAGEVKCIFIDPPYNMGGDSFRYNDRFNHASWLTFMRNRIEVARDLLSGSGSISVILDDTEIHYCKVLMDEIFGKSNYISTISVEAATTSSFKTINTGPTQVTNFIICYCKDRSQFNYQVPYVGSSEVDLAHFSRFIENFESPCEEWIFKGIYAHILDQMGFSGETTNSQWSQAKKKLGAEEARKRADELANAFAIENAHRVFETKTLQKPSSWLVSHLERSRDLDHVIMLDREGLDPVYLYQGRQVYFLGKGMQSIDGKMLVSRPVSNLWTDIPTNNLQSEGSVSFPSGKKPEALIRRIIQMFAGSDGDIVLDFFAGSGTTLAVAHKMGRRWIGIEQMDYIDELTTSRMKKVIEGEQGGISKAVTWSGGGSFVRADLRTCNEAFVTRIRAAQAIADLVDIRTDMLARGYLRHDLSQDAFSAAALEDLSLEEAQALLIGCLDMNHLYVNIGDMADPTYGIPDTERALNRAIQEDGA